jgi:hypothetical protein
MTSLRVDTDHVAVLQLGDEGQGVADRGQQDVAAWLIRLRLDSEPHRVAPLDHVAGQSVHRLPIPVQGCADVLREVDFRTLTAAPEHIDLRTKLSREVDVAHHLTNGVAPHGPVVAGEPTVLEHWVVEQVGGHHRHHHPRLVEGLAELVDDPVPLLSAATWRDQVVVVEGDPVRTHLG